MVTSMFLRLVISILHKYDYIWAQDNNYIYGNRFQFYISTIISIWYGYFAIELWEFQFYISTIISIVKGFNIKSVYNFNST